jgi:hypothetical protein
MDCLSRIKTKTCRKAGLSDLVKCKLHWDDVGSLQSLGAFLDGELHLLAFLQCAVTVGLDSREVDEYVRAIRLGQKSISLAPVEPFDCADNSFRH